MVGFCQGLPLVMAARKIHRTALCIFANPAKFEDLRRTTLRIFFVVLIKNLFLRSEYDLIGYIN
jgi:hypothetical protein